MYIKVAAPTEFLLCAEIRRTVFVEEQGVPEELEMDDFDAVAVHFLAFDGTGFPFGTARLLDRAGAAKIGRVAILAAYRNRGYGRMLMEFVLEETVRRGFRKAMLDSQVTALPFYERLGFVAEGPVFEDAGIPHRHMQRSLVAYARPGESSGP